MNRRGEVWSLIRDAMMRGAAIGRSYDAGMLPNYEAYSARMDAVASELADAMIETGKPKTDPALDMASDDMHPSRNH